MRCIPIENLPEVYDSINGNGAFEIWLSEAENHLSNIRKLKPTERAAYWKVNNYWGKLYSALSKLSENKCWYSESLENSCEFEIEHYRPKAKSIDENKKIIRDDGYWWLSYSWKNYRLAGSLVNKLRKDRFTENNDVYGKGNFFPLEENSPIATPEDKYCKLERALLLDPIKPRDCILISFDKNGEVYPSYSEENTVQNKRAVLSIKYYGLDHTPIKRGRKMIWDKCEQIVDIANNFIRTYMDNDVKREETIDNCYYELAILSSNKQPYSMVVRSFVKTKAKENNYEWLEDALMIMQ